VTRTRSLPGLLLLVVYTTLSLLAPAVVVCHGHAAHGMTALEVAVCGAHQHVHVTESHSHDHEGCDGDAEGRSTCDVGPSGCEHSSGDGVHERVDDQLVLSSTEGGLEWRWRGRPVAET